MNSLQAGSSDSCQPQSLDSSFFRVLNAPFVPMTVPEAPISREGGPPMEEDIHELVTLHDDELHTMTIRTCRVGDRTLTYMNKFWKTVPRHPGIISELYLYKTALKDLMGECVPNLKYVRSDATTFNLGFELPDQPFFIEPSADMPDALKRRTIKTLTKLHGEGVCPSTINLDNILIGADGKIYMYNFHHARYIKKLPTVYLLEAKEFDFIQNTRRLKFKLDYENAREKEKTILANVLDKERLNDIEIVKAWQDPSYRPRLFTPSREEQLAPPLDLSRVEGWFSDLDRQPRRFIMPGQNVEDFERALERFNDVLQLMEDEDEKATAASQQSRILKRKCSAEPEEISSRKRLRTSITETAPTELKSFKNDHLRSGIRLVSSLDVPGSVQENNLVPAWPMVVVRDFVKEQPPKIGTRLKTLGKRLREEAIKEQVERREAKRRRLEQQQSLISLVSTCNPLRWLFDRISKV